MATSSNTHFNFTKRALVALAVPDKGKRIYCYDSKCRGLSLCVYGSGTKTFQLYRKVHGKPERILLGHFPELMCLQFNGQKLMRFFSFLRIPRELSNH